MKRQELADHAAAVPARDSFGGIVGIAELVDCVDASDSPWFFGPFGFVLRSARELPFVPCVGTLGFFEPPPGVLDTLSGLV